jgi:hypothetical protein
MASLESDVPVPPYGLKQNELAEFVTAPVFGAKKTLYVDAASRVTPLLPRTTQLVDAFAICESIAIASSAVL